MMHVKRFSGSGVWYLATPYSKWPAGPDDAAHQAALLAIRLQAAGLVVYSPIVHSHALCVADKSLDHLNHDFWLRIDRTHIAGSCGLIVAQMPGWEASKGVEQEIDWFRCDFKAKPRFLLDLDDLHLTPLM
jgi:hypothetical protein